MLRMTTIQNLFKTLYIKDNKCKREAYQKLFETRVNWVQYIAGLFNDIDQNNLLNIINLKVYYK